MKRTRWAFVPTLGLGLIFLASIVIGFSLAQEEGEESGRALGLDETYDQVHNGVRLILAYHRASFSFIGSVENVTDKTIKKVRVEVHLSNGTELDPTEPRDLAAGEKTGLKIDATGQVFEWWKAHAESDSENKSHSLD
jgi:hypothetical protein